MEEQQDAYDEWAKQYEPDLCALGYRIPAMIAATFVRFVPAETAPILDAGCGGGIQAEPLAMLGYGPSVGIDLSEGMIAVARAKERGVQVKTVFLKSEDLAAQAVVSGDADIGVGTPYALIQKVKAPIRMFYQLSMLRFYPDAGRMQHRLD